MKRWICLLFLVTSVALMGCADSASEPEVATESDTATAESPTTEAGLYAAAREAEHQSRPAEAIRLYRQILADYPESADNYKAQFLIGFVFSEELGAPDSARLAFERVVADYPNSEFVDDAQAMLQFLNGDLPSFEESASP